MDKLDVPEVWKIKANDATCQIGQIRPEERSEFIRRNSHIWTELKEKMAELSHNKCWYCEVEYTRADFHIDHFRPKGKIRNYEDPTQQEEGYWWLAFSYKNFRLSCSYCNSPHRCKDGVTRGKATYFPLCEGSERCRVGEDLGIEKPVLLDPTDPLDPQLLWFLDDGNAIPALSLNKGIRHERANKTIEILNLNDYRTKEKRRILKNRCDSLIRQGDVAYKLLQDDLVEGEQVLREVFKQIIILIEEPAQLSSAARVYLRSSNKKWVIEILQRT